MGVFKNPAVRVLFTDNDDIFFTENLLKLDYKKYWYYRFRKEGYKHIYYIDEYQGGTKISCWELDNNYLCEKQFYKSGLFGASPTLSHKGNFNDSLKVYESDNTDAEQTVRNLLTNNGRNKTVIIFNMSQGCFLSTLPKISSGNLVVLSCPLSFTESLPDKVKSLLKLEGEETQVYDCLKEQYKVIPDDDFEEKQIALMIERMYLESYESGNNSLKEYMEWAKELIQASGETKRKDILEKLRNFR